MTSESHVLIRPASIEDAAGVVNVLETVAAERVHSAIDRAWTLDEQRRYLRGLSPREVIHVAATSSGDLVGCQILDLYSPMLTSMAHVAQIGTFIAPDWRGRGIGRALFQSTRVFARSALYRKLVIQVRASNEAAQSFYKRLGFVECGRLKAQVVIDGIDDDEILMELFL